MTLAILKGNKRSSSGLYEEDTMAAQDVVGSLNPVPSEVMAEPGKADPHPHYRSQCVDVAFPGRSSRHR